MLKLNFDLQKYILAKLEYLKIKSCRRCKAELNEKISEHCKAEKSEFEIVCHNCSYTMDTSASRLRFFPENLEQQLEIFYYVLVMPKADVGEIEQDAVITHTMINLCIDSINSFINNKEEEDVAAKRKFLNEIIRIVNIEGRKIQLKNKYKTLTQNNLGYQELSNRKKPFTPKTKRSIMSIIEKELRGEMPTTTTKGRDYDMSLMREASPMPLPPLLPTIHIARTSKKRQSPKGRIPHYSEGELKLVDFLETVDIDNLSDKQFSKLGDIIVGENLAYHEVHRRTSKEFFKHNITILKHRSVVSSLAGLEEKPGYWLQIVNKNLNLGLYKKNHKNKIKQIIFEYFDVNEDSIRFKYVLSQERKKLDECLLSVAKDYDQELYEDFCEAIKPSPNKSIGQISKTRTREKIVRDIVKIAKENRVIRCLEALDFYRKVRGFTEFRSQMANCNLRIEYFLRRMLKSL